MNATIDYKKLTLETTWDKKELFVYLQVSSRHCTRKWARNSETLSTRNNTEFVIENEDEDIESLLSSSYPDFDPSKFDSENKASRQQTDDIVKSTQFDCSDTDKDVPDFGFKAPFNSQQYDGLSNNKLIASVQNHKAKKEFRNRSSEFTKHNLNMVD